MIITKKLKSKKSKKYSKKSSKSDKKENESTFMRLYREEEEREAKELIAQKEAAKAEKKETERKHKIIMKYMVKLDKKLNETVGDGFYSWVDDPKFGKFSMSKEEVDEMVEQNPEKYAGRHLAEFYIKSFHDKRKEKQLFFDKDTWLYVSIYVYNVKKNGKIEYTNSRGGNWVWRTDDFKITKFSFKFLEFLMREVFDKEIYNFTDLGGVPLSFMIKCIKEEGFKFPEGILQPLAGV